MVNNSTNINKTNNEL